MLIKVKRELSETEALGQQNRGIVNPALTEDQKALLYEYRMDAKLDPRIGLQFTPESDLPWLRPDTVKINLGTYRNFTTPGWFNVAGENEERRDFNLPLDQLKLQAESIDFIYAPFIINELIAPVNMLRMWRDSLKPHGVLALVISDRDELIRQGRKFDRARFSKTELAHAIEDAGFSDWREIDFRAFDLCGNDSANVGFFAER
jgi:hypothetical protein